ncbi:hypothetical protein ACFQ64_26140 [Streptomyces sp. NPDC056460]|uniref:bestrophin-like domain n=1 Tax=Streptomyces sp. NPDC056460 TaxID=3345825 RepID=UPI00369865D2
MLLVIAVAIAALLAGLAANRWLRPRLLNEDDDTGMAVKDLVGPLLTLTVLLLAFVLVTANGSYGKAEVASRGEARALDQLVETAEYAPEVQRARIQADAVCYARAVRTQEWPAMADGSPAPASGRPTSAPPSAISRASPSSACWSPPTTSAPTNARNA